MITFDNLSFWEKETFINHTDYLIIGSGIVGLSTAIYLKERKKDKKVTIIERGYLPTGASTKNAGFSCIGSPSELLNDIVNDSEATVFETVEKRWKGLLNLKSLLGEKNIGYLNLGSHELFLPKHEESYLNCIGNLDYLNSKLKSITGISSVFQDSVNSLKKFGLNGFNHAISHAAEGQIDTGLMMKSLLKKAQELDVQILNGIEVNEINPQFISTNYGAIPFKKLAICTNGFTKRFLPNTDIQPARAQVIITKEIASLKLKGVFHFNEGYYYFRNIGNRVLFGGGRNIAFEEEKTDKLENSKKIIETLVRILKNQIVPYAKIEVDHEWAGIMGVGETKKPIIQEVEDNIYCGIRLGGMGVAIGSLVGKELAELMTKN